MNARNIKRILRKYMYEHNYTQQDIAYKSGLSRSFISMFLNGYNSTTGAPIDDIKTDTAEKLANAMGMTFEELVAKASGQKESKTLPVISCLNSDDDIDVILNSSEEYVVISKDLVSNGPAFGFKIGQDMPDMKLLKNDVVIVLMQEKINSGDLVIAQGKDEPADCVRIYKQSDDSWIVLSDAKEPTYYSQEQQKELRVIGKVVALNRTFI